MMKMRSGGKQKKRDIPRATWEGIWRDLAEPKKRKKKKKKYNYGNNYSGTNDNEKFVFDKSKFCFYFCFYRFPSSSPQVIFPFCFALQMSNGCVLRATSKILYYRWVYNIVSSLFLTVMIVGGNSSWLCLYKVLDRDGRVRDT